MGVPLATRQPIGQVSAHGRVARVALEGAAGAAGYDGVAVAPNAVFGGLDIAGPAVLARTDT